MNVLFIVSDQLRADCLNGALADCVPTPNLDRLQSESAVFANHFTVTAPCGPARASLLTGLYPHRHGSIRNGTPLRIGVTNIAKEVRKLGYEPLLFGYTDSQPDPATHHPSDPDLLSYEGLMPGFREIVEMRFDHGFEWAADLKAKGYPIDLPLDIHSLFRPQDDKLGGPALYSAADSDTAYLTDQTLKHLDIRRGGRPWFAHVTYIRPHPPLVAPAPYHRIVDPSTLPPAIGRDQAPNHPFIDAWFSQSANKGLYHGFDGDHLAMSDADMQLVRATYLGLIAELDHHIGRLLDWLDETAQSHDTYVIFTADHADMLGDFGMTGKASILPQAYHIPLAIRGPGIRAKRHDALSESVDLMPTLLDLLGGTPPDLDGRSLTGWLMGQRPADWRAEIFAEREFNEPGKTTRFDSLGANMRAEMRFDGQTWQAEFPGEVPPLSLPAYSPLP